MLEYINKATTAIKVVFSIYPRIKRYCSYVKLFLRRKGYGFLLTIGLVIYCTVPLLLPVIIFDKPESGRHLSRVKHYVDNDIYNCNPQNVYFLGAITKIGNVYDFTIFGSDRFMLPHETNNEKYRRSFKFESPHDRRCNRFIKALYENSDTVIEDFGCELTKPKIVCEKERLINKENCPDIAQAVFNNYTSTKKMSYVSFVLLETKDIMSHFYSRPVLIIVSKYPPRNTQCQNSTLNSKILNLLRDSHGDPLYTATIIAPRDFGYGETIKYNLHILYHRIRHLL